MYIHIYIYIYMYVCMYPERREHTTYSAPGRDEQSAACVFCSGALLRIQCIHIYIYIYIYMYIYIYIYIY